jgi:hypothetical protein
VGNLSKINRGEKLTQNNRRRNPPTIQEEKSSYNTGGLECLKRF